MKRNAIILIHLDIFNSDKAVMHFLFGMTLNQLL